MRLKWAGVPLYTTRASRGVQRPRSWTPKGSGRYAWRRGGAIFSVLWFDTLGYQVASLWSVAGTHSERVNTFPVVERYAMKKWTAGGGSSDVVPALPADSKLLVKCKRLMEWLTATTYDDGSARTPGSLWIDSDAAAFKAMLKEPSLCLCARIRAGTFDDLMAAVETFLGLDAPPWEPDRFALEKQQKTKKK